MGRRSPTTRVEALLADDRARVRRATTCARRAATGRTCSPSRRRSSSPRSRSPGRSAWERLFEELMSAITVELDGDDVPLEAGLARLHVARPRRAPGRRPRRSPPASRPGLRTRAFVFNTLLADKATDDRLRHYDSWIASRNLANEASDESVQALVDAVQGRYDDPAALVRAEGAAARPRPLADYDRMASVADAESRDRLGRGDRPRARRVRVVLARARRHRAPVLRRAWIDAPARPGKRPGAFCAYTVPSHHPYLLLNWTARRRDVLTLAHELGHGLHAYLARDAGRVPPDDAAHARRDRVGVRRDRHVRPAARA